MKAMKTCGTCGKKAFTEEALDELFVSIGGSLFNFKPDCKACDALRPIEDVEAPKEKGNIEKGANPAAIKVCGTCGKEAFTPEDLEANFVLKEGSLTNFKAGCKTCNGLSDKERRKAYNVYRRTWPEVKAKYAAYMLKRYHDAKAD